MKGKRQRQRDKRLPRSISIEKKNRARRPIPFPVDQEQVEWSIPGEWGGERCFIICGGPSVSGQLHLIPKLRGRIIAVKQAALLRPDADIMFCAARDDPWLCAEAFKAYRGPRIVVRKRYPGFPESTPTRQTLYLRRLTLKTDKETRLSDDPRYVGGFDAGSSAINLAYLQRVSEIVLLGFDMTGGRWVKDHPNPFPSRQHFERHTRGITQMAVPLLASGVRVYNCSPISTVTCFEKRDLGEFV